MRNSECFRGVLIVCLVVVASAFFCPSARPADVDVDMRLNNGGFISFDHFKADLYLNNHAAALSGTAIFGILEISGAYYFWPDFSQDVSFLQADVSTGESNWIFLEFDFPDIDAYLPFGPMQFWGAWFLDMEQYGYDVQEFWLDSAHKWTPTPVAPTPTPQPPALAMISPGSFTMGSPSGEACRQEDEIEHPVTLTREFGMMTTEVTRQMWAVLKAAYPGLPDDPSNTDFSPTLSHPVQMCTWHEAVLFANLLSVQMGYARCYFKDAGYTVPVDSDNYTTEPVYCDFTASGYRLPTESEWEYATRAGTTAPFSCNEPNFNEGVCANCDPGILPTLELYCVYCANSPYATLPAGTKLPNPWGLHDMHGNVMEWCWDVYSAYPTTGVTDPTGPASGSIRAVRGGSWDTYVWLHRSACRWNYGPDTRFSYLGFRLVRST